MATTKPSTSWSLVISTPKSALPNPCTDCPPPVTVKQLSAWATPRLATQTSATKIAVCNLIVAIEFPSSRNFMGPLANSISASDSKRSRNQRTDRFFKSPKLLTYPAHGSRTLGIAMDKKRWKVCADNDRPNKTTSPQHTHTTRLKIGPGYRLASRRCSSQGRHHSLGLSVLHAGGESTRS